MDEFEVTLTAVGRMYRPRKTCNLKNINDLVGQPRQAWQVGPRTLDDLAVPSTQTVHIWIGKLRYVDWTNYIWFVRHRSYSRYIDWYKMIGLYIFQYQRQWSDKRIPTIDHCKHQKPHNHWWLNPQVWEFKGLEDQSLSEPLQTRMLSRR